MNKYLAHLEGLKDGDRMGWTKGDIGYFFYWNYAMDRLEVVKSKDKGVIVQDLESYPVTEKFFDDVLDYLNESLKFELDNKDIQEMVFEYIEMKVENLKEVN